MSDNFELKRYEIERITLSKSLLNSFSAIQNSFKVYGNAFSAIQNSLKAYGEIFSAIQNNLKTIDTSFLNEFYEVAKSFNFPTLDNNFENCVEEIETLDIEIKQEVETVINDIFSDEQNWQQKLWTSIETFKDKNSIIARILFWILGLYITFLLNTALTNGCTTRPTKVYELPQSASIVIHNLTVNQQVTIILDSTPRYYHKISYTDENGEICEGCVSKGSIQITAVEIEELEETAN